MKMLFFVGRILKLKLFFLFFCLFQSCSYNNLDFYGNTNYEQKESKRMNTSFNLDYTIPLYETKNKKHLYHLGGKLSMDYDHFGNEIKTNTFTTIGLDF
jgi:hypothetical protein